MKKVLIIFGGNSTEHYISCKSCASIIKNIDNSLFDYKVAGIDFDGTWYLFDDDLSYLQKGNWKDGKIIKINNIVEYLKNFYVVFPITHGNNGEDGKLQGFLELFNINYVGSKTTTSALLMDKALSKAAFKELGIKQVPYVIINGKYNINNIIKTIDFPMIVKPANGGSSIGINKANTKVELEDAIKKAKKYDKKVVIEKFINARELEVAVLEEDNGLIVSNIGEIKSANEFYDYDAKYINDKSYTMIVKDLSPNVINKIKEYAKLIYGELGIKGYSRIDFFYDGVSIFINEVNTIPGFTDISMYPELMKDKDISYQELITILINNAKKD